MRRIPAGCIVVGADGSPNADRAVAWAADQAALEGRPLVVVTVSSQPPTPATVGPTAAYAITADDLLQGGVAIANDAALLARGRAPELAAETRALVGSPITELTHLSDVAHLLVLGSRGRGPARSKVLGSVSASVTRHASCPVVVCRPDGTHATQGVLVGADGTPESLPVVAFAFRQASLRGQPLTVVHALDRAPATAGAVSAPAADPDLDLHQRLVAESVAGFSEQFPDVRVRTYLGPGPADDALVSLAADHELVVVGRHPTHSLARAVTATTATEVLERAHTTVAVVPEERPPVTA